MNKFKRRTYSVPEFFHDIFSVLKNPALALGVLWGDALPHRFRERLYLAVIAVNGCRYCTYLHTRSALHAGLSPDDVHRLLGGIMQDVPIDEAKAVLYAQHWADSNGRPDADARAVLVETYGAEQSKAVEMTLLLIRIGSLSGNSFDACLFCLSRGRWGLTKAES
jgi:AhpD family alkylhydroperoxidase